MQKDEFQKAYMYPLDSLSKKIEEQGMVVVDGVNRLPVYGEPYLSSRLVITLCHTGVSHGEYDMKPVEYRSHDLSIVYPNHTILAIDSSDDYNVTLVVISPTFYEQLRQRLSYGSGIIFLNHPKIHLDDKQYQCIYDLTRLFKSISKVEINRRTDVIVYLLETLSVICDEFRLKSISDPSSAQELTPTARPLFHRFYDSLVRHYSESREVRFYAQRLCLSPKYFGSIIKKETGLSAGEWIARYVIIRAKTLLRYRPDLTIQQISHQLGFPDAASFSRYFKAGAGLTAKNYREQKPE